MTIKKVFIEEGFKLYIFHNNYETIIQFTIIILGGNNVCFRMLFVWVGGENKSWSK